MRAWFALDFSIRHVGKTRYLVFEKRVVSLPNQKVCLQQLFCLVCDFPSRKFSTGQVPGKIPRSKIMVVTSNTGKVYGDLPGALSGPLTYWEFSRNGPPRSPPGSPSGETTNSSRFSGNAGSKCNLFRENCYNLHFKGIWNCRFPQYKTLFFFLFSVLIGGRRCHKIRHCRISNQFRVRFAWYISCRISPVQL